MRILGNASDNWTRTYRKYPIVQRSSFVPLSPTQARVGLPISVLVTAQNFGIVMGCTPNAQLRNYNPHHANHCLRRDRLHTFRIECVTDRNSVPKSPHDC
jgi:hypothetical protein